MKIGKFGMGNLMGVYDEKRTRIIMFVEIGIFV